MEAYNWGLYSLRHQKRLVDDRLDTLIIDLLELRDQVEGDNNKFLVGLIISNYQAQLLLKIDQYKIEKAIEQEDKL